MIANRREMGDWQTPVDFAIKCCEVVRDCCNFEPANIVEPTCGVGNFIEAARYVFPNAKIYGVELNEDYVDIAREKFCNDKHVEIMQGNFFTEKTSAKIIQDSSALVLGNPPWVTNSMLSSLDSDNLPKKTNYKRLRGIEAITGASNFDICEWIIMHALENFRGDDDMLAMLCKTSVARNVCVELAKRNDNVSCRMLEFDSKKVFNINASACLLICDFRAAKVSIFEGRLDYPTDVHPLAFNGASLAKPLSEELKPLNGKCQLEWRQGVKHDCSKVMELQYKHGMLLNKLGEDVDIEIEYLFPLIKSSQARTYLINDSEMAIPMTQRAIGDDTSWLKIKAPKFWNYLESHAELFDARKSSIYKNAPRYAMFGVGDYSYAKYKVAISGFYKDPIFALAYGSKPIMFDDTCYFLSFDNKMDAWICMLLLNSNPVKEFFRTVAFLDSKRPFSKKVLSRLDLVEALELVGASGLNETADELSVNIRVSDDDTNHFRSLLNKGNSLRLFSL